MFLPAGEKQFEFWVLRRNGLPNINIAKRFRSPGRRSRKFFSMDSASKKSCLKWPGQTRSKSKANPRKF